MKSQEERLLRYLKEGYRVNRLLALQTLGIFELSARLIGIQDRIDIQKGWIEVTNKFGEKCRVREYWSNKN